jgi:hypothetical protein
LDNRTGGTLEANRARLIAFYLPQFHPIPENDAWWGKGFTEWTNVAKAKPLFRGHYQPHLPADLGFYDLRVPETRSAQAELARTHGIEAFCYWHYWFAGKRLLERPFEEVMASGEPRFPFCLAWANDSWTGIWHGNSKRVLIEQTYLGLTDYQEHYYALEKAFADERYLTIDGRKVFIVFKPRELPDAWQFTDCWRDLAERSGFKGFYFIGVASPAWNPPKHGFDGCTPHEPGSMISRLPWTRWDRLRNKLLGKGGKPLLERHSAKPAVYSYAEVVENAVIPDDSGVDYYPTVIPTWDNTPRSASNGIVFHNSSPAVYRAQLEQAMQRVGNREPEKRIVFIKSWNEWAEGNYLEPDQRFQTAYLQATTDAMNAGTMANRYPRPAECMT